MGNEPKVAHKCTSGDCTNDGTVLMFLGWRCPDCAVSETSLMLQEKMNEIAAKDREIRELRFELNETRDNIRRLREKVSTAEMLETTTIADILRMLIAVKREEEAEED